MTLPGEGPPEVPWSAPEGGCNGPGVRLLNGGSGVDGSQRLEALRTVPKADVFRGPFPTGRSRNGLVRRGCSASFSTGLSPPFVRGRAPEPLGQGAPA